METCKRCGRHRPDYIADPTCKYGGYCDWVFGKKVAEDCKCDEIMAADPRRHFKGCPKRKELPEQEQAKLYRAALERQRIHLKGLMTVGDGSGFTSDTIGQCMKSQHEADCTTFRTYVSGALQDLEAVLSSES